MTPDSFFKNCYQPLENFHDSRDEIKLIKQNPLPFSVYKIPVCDIKDSLQSNTCVDSFQNISTIVTYFLIETYIFLVSIKFSLYL